MLLVDVREDYTTFVPDRDPKPTSSPRPSQDRAVPPSALSPSLAGGYAGLGVKETTEAGENLATAVKNTSSATTAQQEQDTSGGRGGGWGSGGSWGGGGSVNWGAGDVGGGGGGGGNVEVKDAEDTAEETALLHAKREDGSREQSSSSSRRREGTAQPEGFHGERGSVGEAGASRTPGKGRKSTRRSRGKGPWTGEFMLVRRRRFLKQVLIRGDNVVMISECPKR